MLSIGGLFLPWPSLKYSIASSFVMFSWLYIFQGNILYIISVSHAFACLIAAGAMAGDEFDPLRYWGEPQKLPLPPSPTPGDSATDSPAAGDASTTQKSATASKPATEKKKSIAKVGTKDSCNYHLRWCATKRVLIKSTH